MLHTFKHPLFKREVLQVRWSTLLLTIALLLPVLTMINNAYDGMEYGWTFESMDLLTEFPVDLFGWFVIPVLIITQFYYTRKESVIGTLAALPFSRREILKHKFMSGALGILVAYSVCLLILTATFFSAGQPISGPFTPIFYWFLVAFMSSLFQYSFYFLIATIMGNSIFAGVSSIFIFYAPFFIVVSTLFQVSMLTDIYIAVEPLFNFLVPQYITYTAPWYNEINITFIKILPLIAGYSIATYALFKASQFFFDKNDFEYNGNMCMFIWAENIFMAGFTLCFGLLALDFAQIFYDGWLYPIALITGFVCFPAGYVLARKLLQITGHQIKFKKA